MKMLLTVTNCVGVSKEGNEYCFTELNLICPNKRECNIVIKDFNIKLPPVNIYEEEVNIEEVDGKYVISDYNYMIGWQYQMAIKYMIREELKVR